jgi:hypothetical protein
MSFTAGAATERAHGFQEGSGPQNVPTPTMKTEKE